MKNTTFGQLACDSYNDQNLLLSDFIVQLGFFGTMFVLNAFLIVYAIKGRQNNGMVIYLLGGLLAGEISYLVQGSFYMLAFNLIFPKGSNTCK